MIVLLTRSEHACTHQTPVTRAVEPGSRLKTPVPRTESAAFQRILTPDWGNLPNRRFRPSPTLQDKDPQSPEMQTIGASSAARQAIPNTAGSPAVPPPIHANV
jgi:hypothetical protein